MTTNNEQEAAAERRDDAAIARDDAAILRDDAAIARDDRDRTSHEDLRADIADTQELVVDGNDAIFRVDGLQDAFFAHLISATNAIEGATQALDKERLTRKKQVRRLAGAVLLGLIVGVLGLVNSYEIAQNNERTCEAINENRGTIYGILERLATRSGPITPENEALLADLRATSLAPLECGDQTFWFTPF